MACRRLSLSRPAAHVCQSPRNAGVDIRTVQELMGHKTIWVTLRYAHLAPVHQLEAVQRLCDTGFAQSGSLTQELAPADLSRQTQIQQDPTKRFADGSLGLQAGMAELADAADSKSAEGNLVGVRPPLPAPNNLLIPLTNLREWREWMRSRCFQRDQ
jgi:hypothetical protein